MFTAGKKDNEGMNALDERLGRIEAVLSEILPDIVDSFWLSRAAGQECSEARTDWADTFLEPGRDLMRRGGKRWRPLVTVLTCEALGGGRRADILAPLTEIPHNGSLIIDDIEDASLTRRGAPSVHLLYGTDLAVNMGNLMYFLPTMILDELENRGFEETAAAALTRDWLAVMRRLHFGQGYDILWHREKELFPDEASYLRMCRFKTGSLSSLAARLGARAALTVQKEAAGEADEAAVGGTVKSSGRIGAHKIAEEAAHKTAEKVPPASRRSEDLIGALGAAWEDLGTGFQILDDVQNLSTGIPGKDRGDDIVEGKKSLPVILHAAKRPEDAGRLAELFAAAAERAPAGDWSPVEEAITLLQRSGSVEEAREKGRRLLSGGQTALENLLPDNEARRLLLDLVNGFRKKMI